MTHDNEKPKTKLYTNSIRTLQIKKSHHVLISKIRLLHLDNSFYDLLNHTHIIYAIFSL